MQSIVRFRIIFATVAALFLCFPEAASRQDRGSGVRNNDNTAATEGSAGPTQEEYEWSRGSTPTGGKGKHQKFKSRRTRYMGSGSMTQAQLNSKNEPIKRVMNEQQKKEMHRKYNIKENTGIPLPPRVLAFDR